MAQILISLFDTHSRAVDAESALLAMGIKPACIELHTGPSEHPSDNQTRDGLAGLLERDRLEGFFSRVFGREERPKEVGHFNRDRGRPRGPTPPTPPCVRVRTRRFGLVTRPGQPMEVQAIGSNDWTTQCSAPGYNSSAIHCAANPRSGRQGLGTLPARSVPGIGSDSVSTASRGNSEDADEPIHPVSEVRWAFRRNRSSRASPSYIVSAYRSTGRR